MLIDRLKEIDSYPFHMPGHKRNTDLFRFDFTEIEATDDLHHPQGILKERMEKAAEIYGTLSTKFLVNGSTCGILAAVCALTKEGDSILIARNCHKSVYNAVLLKGLKPYYVCPKTDEKGICGGISPKEVEKALRENGAKLFVMVSPTYEGVVSDVKAISGVCKKFGCILVVDEAHGAHFSFYDKFPASAVKLGADVVIQSLHKTLPALTQTGLLHICSDRINQNEVFKYLSIFESSSPSYLLLSSADSCIDFMHSQKGQRLFDYYWAMLTDFRKKAKRYILDSDVIGKNHIFDLDPSRLVIFGGKEAAEAIREQNVELEMENVLYSVAISSVGDTQEGFDRLLKAFKAFEPLTEKSIKGDLGIIKPKIILSPKEAESRDSKRIPLKASVGRICNEAVYIYPPGVPAVNVGEEITAEVLELINAYTKRGLRVIGAENNTISIIK
ncbi:MAG: aminotransferase class V-fold PLP-dependent enzyme [Clostridiales bacterium]|nr:aminotransferase class V-fold PLP-dependent enzyme [Clostridiales bacterium]